MTTWYDLASAATSWRPVREGKASWFDYAHFDLDSFDTFYTTLWTDLLTGSEVWTNKLSAAVPVVWDTPASATIGLTATTIDPKI